MSKYPNIQPLGTLTVVTPGTTVLLSVNCGTLGGSTVGTPFSPPLPGSALRGIVLQASSATNVGNVYVLPAGKTAVGNPEAIIAIIAPNNTPVPIPYGVLLDNGILPENFCVDADTGGNVVFGYGIY